MSLQALATHRDKLTRRFHSECHVRTFFYRRGLSVRFVAWVSGWLRTQVKLTLSWMRVAGRLELHRSEQRTTHVQWLSAHRRPLVG